MSARELPVSHEAETAVLAAMLMDPEATAEAMQLVTDAMFAHERHRRLYRAMAAMTERAETVDPLTLAEELSRRGDLEAAGGKDYIAELIDAVPTSANVSYHAGIVRDYAERRHLIQVARRLESEAMAGALRPREIAAGLSSELVQVAAGDGAKGFRRVKELVWPAMAAIEARARGEAPPGVATGYAAIDAQIGGILQGELAFICGVPGSGKTAIALNVLLNAARAGVAGAIVSAEMSERGLVDRWLSNLAEIDSRSLRRGTLVEGDYGRLARAGGVLSGLPLYVDDTARPDVRDVVAKLRHLKTQHPDLQLAVVDFIQLIKCATEDMMALAMTTVSYDLKGAAKELGLAIIATCQVDAQAVEKGDTPRPRLHHLRWSQAMREAGDMIGMVYRPAMYNLSPDRERLEVTWEKMRDLPTFVSVLRWLGKYMRVEHDPFNAEAIAA